MLVDMLSYLEGLLDWDESQGNNLYDNADILYDKVYDEVYEILSSRGIEYTDMGSLRIMIDDEYSILEEVEGILDEIYNDWVDEIGVLESEN